MECSVVVDNRVVFRGNEIECVAFIKGAIFVDVDYAKTLKIESIRIEFEDTKK